VLRETSKFEGDRSHREDHGRDAGSLKYDTNDPSWERAEVTEAGQGPGKGGELE
jgi:hypothetical protein